MGMLINSVLLLLIHNVIFHKPGGADEIRLVNTGDDCKGRVEIKHDARWGTVCHKDWDLKDAEVVCRELRCGSAVSADNNNIFGKGELPVWLSNVKCRGNESHLYNCAHEPWGYDCSSKRDSGVQCTDSRIFNPAIYKVSISVDPKTAHNVLNISTNLKEVTNDEVLQNVSANPERFENYKCVLGSVAIESGKHYWEVNITLSPQVSTYFMLFFQWTMGVASASVNRKDFVNSGPHDTIWTIGEDLETENYEHNPNPPPFVPGALQMVAVYVDYDGGLVSFYNAKTQKHIRTSTTTFTEKVFPYFCLNSGVRMQLISNNFHH